MLDATRLRVLVAVARYGSVTGAAQALNYAQPSISHHIARLEAETGAKLMERAGRGVKLTEAGQLLADRAEEIIGRLDAAEAELATHVGLRQDRVRLAAFGSALSTLVATASAELHADHADAGIQLVQAEPAESLRMLRAGEIDVALVYKFLLDGTEFEPPAAETRSHSSDSQPEGQPVLDEPMFLITAAANSDPGDQPRTVAVDSRADLTATDLTATDLTATDLTITDLADDAPRPATHPAETGGQPPVPANEAATRTAILAAHAGERWITAGEQCDELLLELCRNAGFSPDVALRTSDFVAAQSMVAAGLGVTIVPGLALRAARHPGIEAIPLPGACRRILAATYLAAQDSSAARRLIDGIATTRATPASAPSMPAVPIQAARPDSGHSGPPGAPAKDQPSRQLAR